MGFCEKFPDKRINISFPEEQIKIDVLKIVNKIHNQIYVRLMP